MGIEIDALCLAMAVPRRALFIAALVWISSHDFPANADSPRQSLPDASSSLEPDVIPVSPPVGFVLISIPALGDALVSTPFQPIASSLDDVLAGQLTASTDIATADRILIWDAANSRYRAAAKLMRPGAANDPSPRSGIGDDSVWFEIANSDSNAETISGPVGDNFRIVPGAGFILCNRQNHEQTVRLGGELIVAAVQSVPIPAGLSLLSYPFTSAGDVSETQCSKSTNALPMGQSIWAMAEDDSLWQENRPYPNPFSTSNAPVRIADLILDNDKVTLDIRVTDPSVGSIDVLARDLAPTSVVSDWTGWTLAAANLDTAGKCEVTWTDDFASSSFAGVRLYLVVRADSAADLDGDGIPDPRRRFCSAQSPTPGVASKTAAGGTSSPQTAVPAVSAPVNDSSPALASKLPVHRRTGIVFVDTRHGDDRFSGLLDAVASDDGPKRTIAAGAGALNSGGTMVIRKGTYNEDLRISGKPVRVRIQGNVTLKNSNSKNGK